MVICKQFTGRETSGWLPWKCACALVAHRNKGNPSRCSGSWACPCHEEVFKKLQHSSGDFRKAPLPLVLVRLWAGAGFREGRMTRMWRVVKGHTFQVSHCVEVIESKETHRDADAGVGRDRLRLCWWKDRFCEGFLF